MQASVSLPAAGRPRDLLLISLACAACLLPFAGKAFHIDDPMYIWAARHIQSQPLDFYGFEVNWHGHSEPMAVANKNPPLVSFYIAGIAAVAGWSEVALHLGMVLPALALLLGVYALAARLTRSPRTAALCALTMPVVLVSATTVMADVTMLALWCWALWLWTRGLDQGRAPLLLAAGFLAGLCALTKYFGIALIPLLLVYSAARRAPVRLWLPFLLIPLGMVLGYDGVMRASYGQSPLGHIGSYALSYRSGARFAEKTLIGLSFLGGCLLTGLFAAPLLWRRRVLLWALAATALGVGALSLLERLGPMPLRDGDAIRFGSLVQLALFAACGIQLLALAALDPLRRRGADALLLALWVVGVFAFGAFFNWTANGRAVLPAAPAAAILLLRRMEARRGGESMDARPEPLVVLVPALGVALAVAWADSRLADSARSTARELSREYSHPEKGFWFEGSWGFQYYAEAEGGTRVDWRDTVLAPGDIVLVPANNANVGTLPPEVANPVRRLEVPAASWIATLAAPMGAGFYSDLWGPLPFAVGRAPPEIYFVVSVHRRIQLRTRNP